MKGARALASGTLIFAIVCALPAISAAQDGGAPAETTTTTTPDPSVPADPAPPPVETTNQGGKPGGGHADPEDETATRNEAPPQQADAAERSGAASGSGLPGRARASASARVNMGDFFFSPATVTIAVGDIVTWRNTGHEPHTATADDGSFDTGTVVAGQSGSHMFTSAGNFSYICTIHPNMTGTVRVQSASGGGSGGGGGSAGSGFSGPSEAAAVASPDAAGTSASLPATGMAAGALALVGLALLACGAILRRAGDETDRPSRP